MTTQHQAPEVTSELLPCPFCGGTAEWRQYDDSRPYEPFGLVVAHASECMFSLPDGKDAWITAWNTRATQPLSLTVDDETIEVVAKAIWENDPDHWRRYARAALDRLQSLSLPVDIDRSGLAQEVG